MSTEDPKEELELALKAEQELNRKLADHLAMAEAVTDVSAEALNSLEEENETLKDALEKIVSLRFDEDLPENLDRAIEIAYAALYNWEKRDG